MTPFVLDSCSVPFVVVDNKNKRVICWGGDYDMSLGCRAISSPEGSRSGVSVVRAPSGFTLAVGGEYEDQVLTELKKALSEETKDLWEAIVKGRGGEVTYMLAMMLGPILKLQPPRKAASNWAGDSDNEEREPPPRKSRLAIDYGAVKEPPWADGATVTVFVPWWRRLLASLFNFRGDK